MTWHCIATELTVQLRTTAIATPWERIRLQEDSIMGCGLSTKKSVTKTKNFITSK